MKRSVDKGRNDKCRFGWTGISTRKRVLGGGKDIQRLKRGHLAGSIDSEESRRVIICSLYSYREKQTSQDYGKEGDDGI
jgi:hypothetical protein